MRAFFPDGISRARLKLRQPKNQSAEISGTASHTSAARPTCSRSSLFIFIYTLTNTWAYFQQVELTQASVGEKAARTAFFGKHGFFGQHAHCLIQLCLTSRLLKWLGVGFTLVLMPALSGLGFLAIGYAPILTVLAVFQVVRRATGFALLRPAREILFTVLRREDKYKAKSLIDTFGYRLGDISALGRIKRSTSWD